MAEPANVQAQGTRSQYSDPVDRFWNLYLLDADKEDTRMAERWKGDADGILIFTGLFATTVGSFIIATYPNLQQNSADQSAATLLVITQQLGQITQLLASPSSPVPRSLLDTTPFETFIATPAAIKVNILWILSFFMSLFCALLATLVQQWSRTYIGDTQRRGMPRTRGAIHSFLRVGVERFGFNHAVDAIITLLHISVLLFTAGFLVFMLNINDLVARILIGAVIGATVLYLIMTVLPMIFPDCPYSTPLTLGIQILARYPSVTASRIIKRRYVFLISETSIHNQWDWWYHFFKRLSLPGRRHALTLCRRERSYQWPVHVLNQMVGSLDENDEIFGFVTSLPHYLKSLYEMNFDTHHQLWSQFSYQQNLQPLLDRLLASFDPLSNPSRMLTPHKTDQLARLVLLANAAGVQHKDPSAVISPEGRSIDIWSSMRVCSHLTTHSYSRWIHLARRQNLVVSFFSYCLLSSVYVVTCYRRAFQKGYESKTLEDITFFDISTDIVTHGYETHRDKLLSSLALCGHDYLGIYRLLFFIRVVLHYSTLPESPVATHQNLWLPVLKGLRDLTTELDFDRVSHGAGIAIWRVFSVIGRDDLIPLTAPRFRHQYRGPRLDYTIVFKKYPVIGDALKKLANAMIGRCGDVQIQRCESTPALMQMRDGHVTAREPEGEGPGSRHRRYSFPLHKVVTPLPTPNIWEMRRLHQELKLRSQSQDNPSPTSVQDPRTNTISTRLRWLIEWPKRKKLRDEEASHGRSSALAQ